jgi:hypothetical protein
LNKKIFRIQFFHESRYADFTVQPGTAMTVKEIGSASATGLAFSLSVPQKIPLCNGDASRRRVECANPSILENVRQNRIIEVSSPLAPNTQFNSMSEQDKKRVLSGGLGRNINRSGLQFAIPLWWLFTDSSNTIALRNGSASLVDLGQGAFVATAAHVFREYCSAKLTAAGIGCQLGCLLFDPEARLISCHDDLDIATFRITTEEVAQIGKAVATSGPPQWEPLSPASGDFAFFAGFPAQSRGMTPAGNFATAPYFATLPVTSVTDRQISCRFDREKMIDFSGSGLPPVGYDIGGVSGGPMLFPTLVHEGNIEGIVWRFGGVIVQASTGSMFEQVVAVQAHHIQADGRIG